MWYTTIEAAKKLGISPRAVRSHIERKYEIRKLCQQRGSIWIVPQEAFDLIKNNPGPGRPALKKA
jgi:predicted ArsR family transcriptional regulator